MSKVRQEDLNSAMVSILKKMDSMLDAVNQTYEEQLFVLNRIEKVQNSVVAEELKKQTNLLTSIEAKISAGISKGGDDIGNLKDFESAFGSVGKVIKSLINATTKLDKDSGEKIKSFFTKIGEAINEFTDKVDENKANSISTMISALSGGVIKFALSMTIATPLLILAIPGVLALGFSIRLLLWAAGSSADEESIKGMAAVIALGQSAITYALGMALVAVLAPVVLIGSVILGLSIRALLWSAGAAKKDGAEAMDGVLALSKGALLYSLAMILVVALAPIVLIGSLILGLSFRVLGLGFRSLSNKRVALGLVALGGIILGVLLLAVTMSYFGSTVSWMDLALVGATIGGLSIMLFIAGKFFVDIIKGSLALAAASIALILISTGISIFKSANVEWEDLGKLAATVGGLALIGAIAGAGPIPAFIIAGSAALIVAGIAVMLISSAMALWKTVDIDLEDVKALGASIGMLGVEFGLFGLASPLILLGSAAMMVAGAALLPITLGMVAFKGSGFQKDDADNLEYSLGSIVSGFLGGRMPGGVLSGIKFAAAAASRAGLLFATAPAMILAGAALLPITASLLTFKKADFSKSDADNLEYMLASVVRAFGIVTDYDRQKELGFHVNPTNLYLGVQSLSGAGRILAGLAAGIQAWANLEVNEWEVVNGGTADAKLVIKGRRKLTEADFDAAAYGMSKVISAISAPFAEVGRLEKGETTGNPILDRVFGGGFVSAGIKALKNSGDVIVSLAQGVQAFANMEILEYEVVGAGTKDAILVPKQKRKITDSEIELAGLNISKIIGVVARAFADVGKMEAESSGWFSKGYVRKGVKALAGVGDTVSQITESIIKIATGEIPTFTLINEGTSDQKLVPGLPIKLTDSMLKNAASAISNILSLVGKEVSLFGEWIKGKESSIKLASESSQEISKIITKSADSIKSWSQLTDVQDNVDKISLYFTSIKDLFDPEKNTTLPESSWYFSKFASNIELVKKNADAFDQVSTNFDKIEKSMKLIGQHINGMDLKKLTLTDSMFNALAAMSKNPDAIAKMVGDTMEKSFEELVNALKELADTNKTGEFETPNMIEGLKNLLKPGDAQSPLLTQQPIPIQPSQPKEQGVRINNIQELATALARAIPG